MPAEEHISMPYAIIRWRTFLNNKGNLDAVYSEDIPILMRFFRESKSGQKRAEATLRLKMTDGLYRWSRLIALFQTDSQGEQYHVTGIILDVEQEQQNLEQAKFLNLMPTAIGVFEVIDGTSRQLYMNDEYFRLVEDTREHRMKYNNNFINGIHPDDRQHVINDIRSVVDNKSECSDVCRVITGSGAYKWIRFHSAVAKRDNNYILVYSTYVDVEEEVRSQRAYRESEEKLAIALRTADMIEWEYNCITKQIIQTESSREKHGYDRIVENVPESLVTSGYVHENSIAAFLKMYADLFETKRRVQGEFLVRSKGKEEYWWEHIVLNPVLDEEGNLSKAIGTSMDVTDKKEKKNKASSHLQEENDLFHMICGELGAAVFVVNFSTETISFSKSCEAYALYHQNQKDILTNRLDSNVVHPDDLEMCMGFFRQVKISGQRGDVRCRFLMTDGSYRWVNLIGRLYKTENGENESAIGILVDIDRQMKERKKTEHLLNGIPTGVGIFDIKNGIAHQRYINDAYYRIICESRSERNSSTNNSFFNGVEKSDWPAVGEVINAIIDGADHVDFNYHALVKDGSTRLIRFQGNVILRQKDHISVYCSFSDITEMYQQIQDSLG